MFLIFYYINKYSNKNTFEKFTGIDQGNASQPVDWNSMWGNSSGVTQATEQNQSTCSLADQPCRTSSGFGVCNDNLECIIYNTTMEEDEEDEEETKRNTVDNVLIEEETYPEGCYPNDSNFYEICNNQDSTYGVKRIVNCTKGSRVECGRGYINGIYYGDKIVTPCLNKKDDFDSWCRYYNTNPIPDGFNVNSIGASEILLGKDGDCYVNGDVPDTNSARAVCDYNHIDAVTRLDRDIDSIDYNKFTTCFPLKDTNFIAECAAQLNQPYNTVLADQIAGYDCNPGYGRAKCIKRSDIDKMELHTFNKYKGFWGDFDPNNSTVNCDTSCC
jgi:hypothetical protein